MFCSHFWSPTDPKVILLDLHVPEPGVEAGGRGVRVQVLLLMLLLLQLMRLQLMMMLMFLQSAKAEAEAESEAEAGEPGELMPDTAGLPDDAGKTNDLSDLLNCAVVPDWNCNTQQKHHVVRSLVSW